MKIQGIEGSLDPQIFGSWNAQVARLAIFIDAGYSNSLAQHTFRVRIDYESFRNRIHEVIAAETVEPLDLLRT